MSRLFISLFLFFYTTSSFADVIAVLPFTGDVEDKYRTLLAESVRSGVSTVAHPEHNVYTRENMLVLADNMGVDLSCVQGSCEVETGKNLQADFVLSGSVELVEGSYVLVIKIFNTKTAALVSTKTLIKPSVLGLIPEAEKGGVALTNMALFGTKEGKSEGGVKEPPKYQDEAESDWAPRNSDLVIVHFTSEPAGAAVNVDGSLVCVKTPCQVEMERGVHRVQMGKKDHYSHQAKFDASSGITVDGVLKPKFGTLELVSEPPGVQFLLDNRTEIQAPVRNMRMKPGPHELQSMDPCYYRKGQRWVARPGNHEAFSIKLKPKPAAISVSARDSRNDAVGAQIYVDGAYYGVTPSTYKIPMCSKVLEVRYAGRSWRTPLELEHKRTKEYQATFQAENRTARKSPKKKEPVPRKASRPSRESEPQNLFDLFRSWGISGSDESFTTTTTTYGPTTLGSTMASLDMSLGGLSHDPEFQLLFDKYLKKRSLQLHHELNLGQGEAFRELGLIFGVSTQQMDLFSNKLRTNRKELSAYLSLPGLQASKSLLFFERVRELATSL